MVALMGSDAGSRSAEQIALIARPRQCVEPALQACAQCGQWIAQDEARDALIVVGPARHQTLQVVAARAQIERAERGVAGMCHVGVIAQYVAPTRSEEPTSELQSLMRTSYAVFCLQ